jgi:hypothetical protein
MVHRYFFVMYTLCFVCTQLAESADNTSVSTIVPTTVVLAREPWDKKKPHYLYHNYAFFDIFLQGMCLTAIGPLNTPANTFKVIVKILDKVVEVGTRTKLVYAYLYSWCDPDWTHVSALDVEMFYNTSRAASTVKFNVTRALPPNALVNKIMCTLFKHNPYGLEAWLHYHFLMGIDHAYLYFHGPLELIQNHPAFLVLQNLSRTFEGRITLIQWTFPYWYPGMPRGTHMAQSTSTHHCLYRFGYASNVQWLLGFDTDEYLFLRHMALDEFIQSHPYSNCFLFRRVWMSARNDLLQRRLPLDVLLRVNLVMNASDARNSRTKYLIRTKGAISFEVHGAHDPLWCTAGQDNVDPQEGAFAHFLNIGRGSKRSQVFDVPVISNVLSQQVLREARYHGRRNPLLA